MPTLYPCRMRLETRLLVTLSHRGYWRRSPDHGRPHRPPESGNHLRARPARGRRSDRRRRSLHGERHDRERGDDPGLPRMVPQRRRCAGRRRGGDDTAAAAGVGLGFEAHRAGTRDPPWNSGPLPGGGSAAGRSSYTGTACCRWPATEGNRLAIARAPQPATNGRSALRHGSCAARAANRARPMRVNRPALRASYSPSRTTAGR